MKLKDGYIITEGIEGYWHYHISHEKSFTKSLCGKQTMKCNLPEKGWGVKSHLRERYCSDCINIMSCAE
jgi:hypothetical protein